MISNVNFNAINTYCLILNMEAVGFIGINHKKIEMLFYPRI
jgi:hypothetical protein